MAVKAQNPNHWTSGEFPVDWNLLTVALVSSAQPSSFFSSNPFLLFLPTDRRACEGQGQLKEPNQPQFFPGISAQSVWLFLAFWRMWVRACFVGKEGLSKERRKQHASREEEREK